MGVLRLYSVSGVTQAMDATRKTKRVGSTSGGPPENAHADFNAEF